MNSPSGSNFRLLALRTLGGAGGGFVWGALREFLNSFDLLSALRLGMFTLIAGAIAAMVGHFLFASVAKPSRPRSVVNWAVIGGVFIGVSHLLAPSDLVASVATGNLLISVIGGAVGGAFGGLVYEVISESRRAKAGGRS